MLPGALPGSETGTLPGGLPYARTGAGSRTLAVLPGFGDAMFPGVYPPGAGWAIAPYFARHLASHEVVLLSRPRGLPPGYDAGDAVEHHAAAFEALAGSSDGVDVLGISMGGQIGQALARRRPELVDRLVLANTACRLDESARPDVRELEALARRRDWAAIRAELARGMYADARAVAGPPLIRTVGRFVLPRPAEPADVWRSIEFVLAFDDCDDLADVEQPALVFGGERDPYFTPEVARETAEGLPDADLTLVPGAKHAAFDERKNLFDARVRAFFRSRPPRR